MMKIIDRTLSQLGESEYMRLGMQHNENDMQRGQDDIQQCMQLLEMCNLLVEVGVDYIELSIPVLNKIKQLPEEGHYILQIEKAEDIEAYPGFDGYVYKGERIEGLLPKVIHEVEVDSLDALTDLEEEMEKGYVRLTVMDELIHDEEYGDKMKTLIRKYGKHIDFCPKDSRYCATALDMEWLMHNGSSVSVSFNGIGSYAKLEEVLMGIKVIMHKRSQMDLHIMPRISTLYEKLTQQHIYYNKAVVGKNIFNVEAGVQQSNDKKKEFGYEPYDPKVVGKVRRLVIGKHSGSSAIKLKLKEKGVKVPEGVVEQLVEEVKVISMNKGRSLTDQEFLHLVKEVTRDEA